ncbi:DUF2059 domain-containing protein [Paracoccus caeni]|uniref:DUF2059 domain-containing protein n=1 Tax=Paracoccus caeni TaxID=657651 RepID=A0A934SE45_9RHOB|nr:DUF2059 domain-containing protein [Paracoccus caeni]MBK4215695.1 DUF2059 domain-containing protein [Paracoccus caeni]
MLRNFCLCVALLIATPISAQPVSSEDLAARVWQVMEMEQMMPVLRDEALDEADDMAEMLFQRGGTGAWLDQVGAIHDPARMQDLFVTGMQEAIPTMDAALIGEALDFYETALGKRIMALEVSARIAFMDEAVEADARATYQLAATVDAPRVAQIDRLIDGADLIDPNVAGGLNAAIAFSNGFNDGGGYPMPMTEDQILSDAWAQEAQVRQDTIDWLNSYLLMTYAPLSDAELDEFVSFAETGASQALAGLLFAGFDHAYRQTSYELGLAAAGQLGGRDL